MVNLGKSLEQTVEEMNHVANMLIPHTFPLVSIENEQKIVWMKERQIVLDGYQISVSFSKSIYPGDNSISSLQICSVHTPFLPFNIICKIGKAFLGDECLGYAEFFKCNLKIYCWTLRYQEDNKIPPTEHALEVEYEGLKYRVLPQGCSNLYNC